MDITWGEFSFHCEKTVAILLALAPVVFVMQIVPAAKIVRRLVKWAKTRHEVKHPEIYGHDVEEGEETEE